MPRFEGERWLRGWGCAPTVFFAYGRGGSCRRLYLLEVSTTAELAQTIAMAMGGAVRKMHAFVTPTGKRYRTARKLCALMALHGRENRCTPIQPMVVPSVRTAAFATAAQGCATALMGMKGWHATECLVQTTAVNTASV